MRNYLDLTRSKKYPFMRDVFIDEIYKAALKDKNIYFLTPDMGAPSLDKFREKIPNQFIHCGISEQHMIAMAAGLSLKGKKVFCYAMAPFITSRCYEQIKCSIAAMDQNVNLVGIGVGLGYADAGPTHYTTEDIATMRVFPNIEILTPSDELSTSVIANHCIQKDGFRFIRLDRDALPEVYKNGQFELSSGFIEIRQGKKICVVSSGYILNQIYHLMEDAEFGLIDLFRIKPIDKKLIEVLKKYEKVISIEEQWIEGGMGSKILEIISDNNLDTKVERKGLDEIFFFQNGGRDFLHKKHGLNIPEILKKI
jgi:transketolase